MQIARLPPVNTSYILQIRNLCICYVWKDLDQVGIDHTDHMSDVCMQSTRYHSDPKYHDRFN